MSDAEWLALKPSPLVQRLDRRRIESIGVIDVRHPQAHYSRIVGWIAERFPLLIELAERHGSDGQDGPGYDELVYSSSAVLSTSDPPAAALNTESHALALEKISPHAANRYPDSATIPVGRFRVVRPVQVLAASMEAAEPPIARAPSSAVHGRSAKSALPQAQGLELSPAPDEGHRPQTFLTRNVGNPEPEIPSVPRDSSQSPDPDQPIARVTAPIETSAPFPAKVEDVVPRGPSSGFTHLPEEGEGNAAVLGPEIAVVHESLASPTTEPAQTVWRVRRGAAGSERLPPPEPLAAISTEPGTLSRTADDTGETFLPHGKEKVGRGVEHLSPSKGEGRNEIYSSSQGQEMNETAVSTSSLVNAEALLSLEVPTGARTVPLVLRRQHAAIGGLVGEGSWSQEDALTDQSSRQGTSARLHTGVTEHSPISQARILFRERPRLRLSKREWAQLVDRLIRVISQKLAIDLERRGIRAWR
jgi:hypothetical protein